jgi:hypothetical protein
VLYLGKHKRASGSTEPATTLHKMTRWVIPTSPDLRQLGTLRALAGVGSQDSRLGRSGPRLGWVGFSLLGCTHQQRVQLSCVVGEEPGGLLAQLADLGDLWGEEPRPWNLVSEQCWRVTPSWQTCPSPIYPPPGQSAALLSHGQRPSTLSIWVSVERRLVPCSRHLRNCWCCIGFSVSCNCGSVHCQGVG